MRNRCSPGKTARAFQGSNVSWSGLGTSGIGIWSKSAPPSWELHVHTPPRKAAARVPPVGQCACDAHEARGVDVRNSPQIETNVDDLVGQRSDPSLDSRADDLAEQADDVDRRAVRVGFTGNLKERHAAIPVHWKGKLAMPRHAPRGTRSRDRHAWRPPSSAQSNRYNRMAGTVTAVPHVLSSTPTGYCCAIDIRSRGHPHRATRHSAAARQRSVARYHDGGSGLSCTPGAGQIDRARPSTGDRIVRGLATDTTRSDPSVASGTPRARGDPCIAQRTRLAG